MEWPSWSTKDSNMQYLDAISKTTEWSLFVSKANHSISVIQVYAPTTNAEEAEAEWFYDDLQDLLELTPKWCPFHHRGLDAKVGSQEIPGITGNYKLRQAKANRVLPRECTVIANTFFQQHKRWLYIRASPDGQCRNEIDYILCRRRWRKSIQSAKTRLWADCDSDHQFLSVKFRFKESRENH